MEDGASLRFDTSELREALQDAIRLSSREMPAVIDGVARDLCFAAMRKTKTVAVSRIERLRNKPIMHATATLRGKPKGTGNAAEMNRIVNRRLSARGYSKAIWMKIAGDLGARLRTEARNIKHATGAKAREGIHPTATLDVKGLASEHVARVMQPALDKAVPMVAQKMRDRTARKLADIAARKSGRR
jgi:hypothetical protein